MTGEPARLQWPSSAPPPAEEGWNWEFSHVSQLPRARAELRAGLAAFSGAEQPAELDEAVVLAAVQTFQLEDARLLAVRREVGLVEEALRGRRYRVRM